MACEYCTPTDTHCPICRPANAEPEDWPEDVSRVQNVIESHGFACSRELAEAFWLSHSEAHLAGWLTLPDDDDAIWEAVRARL